MRLVLIRGTWQTHRLHLLTMSFALGGLVTVGHASSLPRRGHGPIACSSGPPATSPSRFRITPSPDDHFIVMAPTGIDEGMIVRAPTGIDEGMIFPMPRLKADTTPVEPP